MEEQRALSSRKSQPQGRQCWAVGQAAPQWAGARRQRCYQAGRRRLSLPSPCQLPRLSVFQNNTSSTEDECGSARGNPGELCTSENQTGQQASPETPRTQGHDDGAAVAPLNGKTGVLKASELPFSRETTFLGFFTNRERLIGDASAW